jgi:hypothetical protein
MSRRCLERVWGGTCERYCGYLCKVLGVPGADLGVPWEGVGGQPSSNKARASDELPRSVRYRTMLGQERGLGKRGKHQAFFKVARSSRGHASLGESLTMHVPLGLFLCPRHLCGQRAPRPTLHGRNAGVHEILCGGTCRTNLLEAPPSKRHTAEISASKHRDQVYTVAMVAFMSSSMGGPAGPPAAFKTPHRRDFPGPQAADLKMN